jgi:hypothetical protein
MFVQLRAGTNSVTVEANNSTVLFSERALGHTTD